MDDELVTDSLVYRYDPAASPDGLRGSEGTFSLCTFTYVDALARAGRLDEARLVFEKMLTYANHVGLFSEEIALTGEQIGNFPQAFTHLALIDAAITLDQALDQHAAAAPTPAHMGAVGLRAGGSRVGREQRRRGHVVVDGLPALLAGRHPLAMVYGGGGVFGIAYTAGVAEGLRETGVPVDSAPALGTSAGSWTAAALALGLTYDDFARHRLAPGAEPALRGARRASPAGSSARPRHPLVAVSAVCVRTRRRHILDGGRYPLADLVAASSAVPGLLPPHRIDGRLYVDGGMWSATSVDAAAEADRVIVVAPLAGRVMGPMGRTAGFLLERELRQWRTATRSGSITMIRPDRAMARVAGLRPLALFDDARAREVYPMAVEQGRRLGALMGDGRRARRPDLGGGDRSSTVSRGRARSGRR